MYALYMYYNEDMINKCMCIIVYVMCTYYIFLFEKILHIFNVLHIKYSRKNPDEAHNDDQNA